LALAVLKLADEAIPALGLMPADCTDACEDGPCNCSGQHRTVAWNLDPAKVREAITRELAGTPPNTPEGE
jgi:(2Fe-2S) ferredoxin